MGDLQNIIYLLAMDKEQVIRNIEKSSTENPREYLEKIVQLPFYLLPITEKNLEDIFLDRLKPVLNLVPEGEWNQDYWMDIYYAALKYFFKNCRDIAQYINIIAFNYPRVRDVVNPQSIFLQLKLFRFLNQRYSIGVQNNKDLFTDLTEGIYQQNPKQLAEDKLRCDEILNRAEKTPKDLLVKLLIRLFPRIRHIYQPHVAFYHSKEMARKNHRICSADVFDVYFRLALHRNYISSDEMNIMLTFVNIKKNFLIYC